MANKYRTHKCNELTEKLVDKKVRVAGFVENIRDHGGVQFVDLRDNYGKTQVVVHDESLLKGITKEIVVDSLAAAGIESSRRAETLNLEEFASVANEVKKRL